MPGITKVLYQGQLAAAAGALYTVPANKHAYVKQFNIVNPDTVSHWVKLWVGGSADTNLILPQRTLQAGETVVGEGLLTLEAAKAIQGQADVATKVTVTISGLEMDGVGPS